MIVADASALVGWAIGEPEADRFKEVIRAGPCRVTWPGLLETRLVLSRLTGMERTRAFITALRSSPGVAMMDVDADLHDWAAIGFERFGKGRHPAGLNFGDCFSYGAAKALDAELLFKGTDFALTDVRRHAASV